MSVIRTKSIEEIKDFANTHHQLGIVERKTPHGADDFFQKLMQTSFRIIGKVTRKNVISDTKNILQEEIPKTLQNVLFFDKWIEDIAKAIILFCDTQESDSVGFWLGTERGCRRYHIDNVPLRLLITYAGKGTEWLPDEVSDRLAFTKGEPNGKIVRDPTALQFMKAWDIGIFRGGPKGLLHRTPDDALNGPSILLRLDHPSFWDDVHKNQHQNDHIKL